MKKEYIKPQVEVVRVNICCQIMAGSLRSVGGNTNLTYEGGSSSGGRSRDYDDWDDE